MTRGRKPKPEGYIRHCTNGNILQKRNNEWVYIGCDLEGKRVNRKKYSKKKPLVTFPPVQLPDHIRPTKYPHYYVSNDGVAYREPRQIDRNGAYGEVNEWGLIQLTTTLRGNPNYGKEFMYESVNIYFYDENNKNVGYKKRNIHQLVAEVWVPNPHGYTEVLHGNKGNRCNHYTNLRWGTHKENMKEAKSACPEGTQRRTHGKEGSLYEKKDGEWVLIPSNEPAWNKGKTYKLGPDHAWNKGKTYSLPDQQSPEGTISVRKNGATYKKIDGKWVYQKKEKLAKQDDLC